MNQHYKTIAVACIALIAAFLTALAFNSMTAAAAVALCGAVLFALVVISTMRPQPPTGHRSRK